MSVLSSANKCVPPPEPNGGGGGDSPAGEESQFRRAGILEQSMWARNRVGIRLSYRPARLHRLGESIPWNQIPGLLKCFKIPSLEKKPSSICLLCGYLTWLPYLKRTNWSSSMPDHPRCKKHKSLHFLAKILAQTVPQSVCGVLPRVPPGSKHSCLLRLYSQTQMWCMFFSGGSFLKLFLNVLFRMIMVITRRSFKLNVLGLSGVEWVGGREVWINKTNK